MTSHLLYEGSQLERVLERVRADHGPEASIVSADRVRSGGLAGFFAKELFRVTVAVDAIDAAAADDVTDAVDALGAFDPAAEPASAGAVTLGRIGDGVEEADLELWGILDDGLAGTTSARPEAGPAFAAALEAAIEELPALELEAEPQPSEAPRVVSGLRRHDPPLPVGSRHLRKADDDGLGRSVGGLVTSRLDAPRSTAGGDVARVVELRPHRVRRERAEGANLGRLLEELERGWTDPAALVDDGLVVVVGAPGDARRVAAMAADAVGMATSEVRVAAPGRSASGAAGGLSVEELEALRRSVAGPGLRLLVVEVLPGRDGHDWARAAILALEAAQVRLALSAERPTAALQLVATALGGPEVVDVIDLVDLDRSPEPEALVELDVPVATLDGRTASPALWAAVLMSTTRVVTARIDRPSSIAR